MSYKIPKYIVVDGPDGCGKTTAIRFIKDYLTKSFNQDVVIMKALGQGAIGAECRKRHLSNQAGIGLESLMMPTSIMEAYYDHVLPTLNQGKCVIMDRWISSYYAYQIKGRDDHCSKEIYNTLFDNDRTPMIRKPDIYFIGDVDQSIADKRLKARDGDTNYLDNETSEFKQRVMQGFNEFKDLNSDVISLDCNRDIPHVNLQITTYIDLYVKSNGDIFGQRKKLA